MIGWLLLSAAVVAVRVPRWSRRERSQESSIADLARLLAIAVAAGLPLGAGLEAAARELEGELGEEVRRVVRSARTAGLTASLLAAPALGALGPALARAHSSGSPLGHTLDAHLGALSAERVSRALERVRTAPVRVMVPLALLLLPGFTALVVGPTLLDHLVDMTTFGP